MSIDRFLGAIENILELENNLNQQNGYVATFVTLFCGVVTLPFWKEP